MSSDSSLRELLAQTALRLGPDAPTLCPPWDVRELVAHLVVRESRPDVLPGIGLDLGVLRKHTANVQSKIAEGDFGALVQRFRGGPPSWSPVRVAALGALVNTTEFAIHHEDLVRAQPAWEPTTLSPAVQQSLWGTLGKAGRLFYRSAGVGVVAISEGVPSPRVVLHRPGKGHGTVVLRGTPLELVLHAFGRTSVAQVEVEGDDADVATLAAHTRGA